MHLFSMIIMYLVTDGIFSHGPYIESHYRHVGSYHGEPEVTKKAYKSQ